MDAHSLTANGPSKAQQAGTGSRPPLPLGRSVASKTRAHTLLLVRSLLFVVIVAALAIVAGTIAVIVDLRNTALDAASHEAKNLAAMIARDTDRSVRAIERVQQGLVDRVEHIGIKSAADYETRLAGYDAHLMLKDVITGLPHVESVAFVSANGKVFNTSRAWPNKPIDVSDRDYFKLLTSDPHFEFAWSDPVRNRTTGTWSMYLARKVFGPNREFLGFVTAGLELQSFERRFASLAPDNGISISLFGNDGTLVAQFPHFEDAIGLRSPPGQMRRPIGADADSARVTAVQPVTRYPAEIVVAIAAPAVLAHWRTESLGFTAGAAALLFLIAGVPLIAARRLGGTAMLAAVRSKPSVAAHVRELIHNERHKQAEQQINRKQRELEAAAENMPQGLVMFDAEARLVVCNGRYIEMYGLSPEIAAPGRALSEIIAYRIERGGLSTDGDALAAVVKETVRAGKPWRHVAELPDGRSIDIMTTPLRDGGWVATHEDITKRRRAERQLLRTERFLATVIENVPTTITIKDARSLKYLLINRAGERYFGLLRSEIIGKTAHELFPQGTADLIERHDRKLLTTGKELYISEHVIDTPAGEPLAVTVRRLPIMDQNGQPQFLLSLIENVTERKLLEAGDPPAAPEAAKQSPALVD